MVWWWFRICIRLCFEQNF